MAASVQTLTKDVWTKVLTNVTNLGSVYIIDQEIEPTEYLVTLVDTGTAAPALDFAGGVKVVCGFSPAETDASDYYMMPVNSAGKVAIYT